MYLDSAILVKLVLREPDSEYYADLVEAKPGVMSSELAIVECRSALLRKREQRQIDNRLYTGAWSRLEGYWAGGGGVELRPVSLAVLNDAGTVMQRCSGHAAVRSLDAIHVATCMQWNAYPLVTNDTVMRAAAGVLGIPLSLLPE